MSVVEFSTENVTGTHTSGPVAGYIDGALPLDVNYDNSWGGIQKKDMSADGSVATFYYVQGKGNPVNIDKIDFEEIVTDGVGTGKYKAKWDDSYYLPDGSAGLPTNGTYVTLTPSTSGTMTVAAWVNKDNREIYVVKASDCAALALNTEVTAAGYINELVWNTDDDGVLADDPLYGYPKYQESIEISENYIIGDGTKASWVYLTFQASAHETYYIFNKSTQIGFSGFTFTPDETGGNTGSDEPAGGDYGEEYWFVNNGDGTLKDVYVANPDANAMSVVEFSTENVTGTHTSGPVAGYVDGELPLEVNYDNSWGGITVKDLSKDGSVAPFYYVQGKGNPVNIDKIAFEEIVTDDVPTGNYRANWDDSYYLPDGSAGLPTNGTYVTLTPATNGTMTVAAWINKGNRELYIVKASDCKALAPNTEVTATGYINGTNWNTDDDGVLEDDPLYGYPKYLDPIEISDDYVVGNGNQTCWVYLTFQASAGETYYIFNKSTQIGFSGFTFVPAEGGETGISEVRTTEANPDAPIYNLAGQRVGKDAKGLLIQNGRKFIRK